MIDKMIDSIIEDVTELQKLKGGPIKGRHIGYTELKEREELFNQLKASFSQDAAEEKLRDLSGKDVEVKEEASGLANLLQDKVDGTLRGFLGHEVKDSGVGFYAAEEKLKEEVAFSGIAAGSYAVLSDVDSKVINLTGEVKIMEDGDRFARWYKEVPYLIPDIPQDIEDEYKKVNETISEGYKQALRNLKEGLAKSDTSKVQPCPCGVGTDDNGAGDCAACAKQVMPTCYEQFMSATGYFDKTTIGEAVTDSDTQDDSEAKELNALLDALAHAYIQPTTFGNPLLAEIWSDLSVRLKVKALSSVWIVPVAENLPQVSEN